VDERDWLTAQFETHRPHLRGVAYRMLGSLSEAEDAVQECWLRLDRSRTESIDDLRGWLTVVVGRICLDMLRSRRARREDYVGSWLPEPLVRDENAADPEEFVELADSVGLALLVVLETLTPAERLAFVLHDVFAVPFDEIADVVGRSPAAARQLASRARQRVQNADVPTDADLALQRRLVDAFLAAAQSGDFDALLDVLDPEVTFRVDVGAASRIAQPPVRGASAVARRVLSTAPRFLPLGTRPVLVNGSAGLIVGPANSPIGVAGFTVSGGRIVAIDVIADPAKLKGIRTEPQNR